MIQPTLETSKFKQRLHEFLKREVNHSYALKVDKNSHVYNSGDRGDVIYFIEKGHIKLSMLSPEGKECLLAIHREGDLFGELCLTGLGERLETAIAMKDTSLKQIPRRQFVAYLANNLLLDGFIMYLTERLTEQQQAIANLIMGDSKQRLGRVLLQLARTIGSKDIKGIRIEVKFSQQDLSNMVGTTRPRISVFLQLFKNLNLIEITKDHYLIVKEPQLVAYLDQVSLNSCLSDAPKPIKNNKKLVV